MTVDAENGVTTARRAMDRLRALMGHRVTYSPRQEEILSAIETLLLQENMSELNVGELAARVQCSRKTLYEMAPSKEQLFLLVLYRMWRRLAERALDEMSKVDDPAAQIETFLREALSVFTPPWSKFMDEIQRYPAASALFFEHVAIMRDLLSDLVAAGISVGRFRPVDPQVVGSLIVGGALHMASRDFEAHTTGGPADAIPEMTRVLFYGLVAGDGDPART